LAETDLLQSEQQNPSFDEPSTSGAGLAAFEEGPIHIKLGAFYDPDFLPDHRGDLFQQTLAKLVQQDIKDTNDELVAPWDMQHKLRPGTIVVVDTTLVCWDVARGTSNARKVYQVQAHRVKILHESDEPVEQLGIPTLPQKPEQQMFSFGTSPRKAPSSTFMTFGSPSKKPRRS